MGKYQQGQKITDQNGRVYTLDQKIGKGGQGVVWTLKEGDFAVKFLKTNRRNREEVLRRIQRVARLDLQDLPVSVPWVTLQAPSVGYIMKLVRGLKPLGTLIQSPQESFTQWYLDSGSLRWRLRVLSVIAEVLSNLHGKGLAFADPSPNNFMISSEICDFPKVYLIDADNMEPASSMNPRILYTPRYGAPELVMEKRGVNTLSDAHAFSVLAYEVLTSRHPLIGDDIDDGPPEEEEKALAGQIPWVGHTSDDSNWCERGITPTEMVISSRMRDLFTRTFEDGLNDPPKRPGMGKWAEVLLQASDMTVYCDRCKGSYYRSKAGCPWCGVPIPKTRVACFYMWDPDSEGKVKFIKTAEGKLKIVHAIILQKGHPVKLCARHFFNDPQADGNAPVAEITLLGGDASIRNVGADTLYARSFPASEPVKEREIKPGQDMNIPADGVEPRWNLALGDLDAFHRSLAI